MEIPSPEELELFLKENETVKLWTDEEIQGMIDRGESVSGEGFVKDYEDKEIGTLVEQRPGKSGCLEVRSRLTIKGRSPLQFFNFIIDADYGSTYDTMVKKSGPIKQLTKEQCVAVYESKQIIPWLVSGRDFVYVSYAGEFKKPSHYILISRGCEYDKYPEIPGVVRGWCDHTMFYAIPHPDNPDSDTLIIYMASADGKGKIPQWVANWITRKFAPGYTKQLRIKCIEHEEYLKKKKEEEVEGEED